MSAAQQIRGLARDLTAASDEALAAVAKEAESIAVDEAKRATGGSGRLRNMGGAPMHAQTTITSPALTIEPTPRGPWTLIDAGSHKKRGGWFLPRRRSLVRRGGKVRVVNGVRLRSREVRPFVHHPPIRGRKAWEKATKRIVDATPDLAFEHVDKAVRSL